MSEPHQRTRSGKLRHGFKQQVDKISMHKNNEQKIVYTGISNARELTNNNTEDEILHYYQSPAPLRDYQKEILEQITKAFELNTETAIDSCFRRTWNLGSWHIDTKLSISFNIMQPNISNLWANIDKVNKDIVKEISKKYTTINLQNASCKVIEKIQSTSVQVQGRWTTHLINDLLENNYSRKENINITNVVIGQSTLFCWIILKNNNKFLCYFTKDSINILRKYIPESIKDIDETSSKGGISFKVKNSIDDASQLNISESGNLHYQGKFSFIYVLYSAVYLAIQKMMESIHITTFIESLEYKIFHE